MYNSKWLVRLQHSLGMRHQKEKFADMGLVLCILRASLFLTHFLDMCLEINYTYIDRVLSCLDMSNLEMGKWKHGECMCKHSSKSTNGIFDLQ